jgi:hypothetical protein
MTRVILFLLLAGNALTQLLGGAMMIARPEQLGRDTFGLSADPGVLSLVPLVGGVTLSYALLSLAAAIGVLGRRDWARLLVLLMAAMLALVGLVMLGHGMRIGAVDLAKGAVLALGALAYSAAPVSLASKRA